VIRTVLSRALDQPALFRAARFPLVGRQAPTKRFLRAQLAGGRHDTILDVCCGTGEFAAAVDGQYVGVDMNPRFIVRARRTYRAWPARRFHMADALALPFADRRFDRVFAINCLHHFSDDDALQVLAEIRRVARDLVLIVDIDGTRRGLVRRCLLAMDRGTFMRTPARLATLVGRVFDVAETVHWDVGLYTEVAFRCPVAAPTSPAR
jgi:ubiquinone/menaquinone biosynthesis C-methylase UbiE